MAKNKKAKAPEVEDNLDVVYDGIPGADKVTDEDVKPFDVDLNFEDEPKAEDIEEDVEETTEEEEVEEVEETEPEVAEEEPTEGEEPEGEEPVEEAEGEGTESDSPEGVPEEPADDTRQSEEPVSEGADEEATKEPMIPKKRFDEVLAKQKALQKQLEEATNPQEKVEALPDYDFQAKELEYQQHILNGEGEKAAELRSEIREQERQTMLYEVQQQLGQTVQQSTEAAALQAKALELQAEYPVLDENHVSYDEVKAQEVMDLRDAYMIQGFQAADALQKATTLLMPAKEVESAPSSAPDPVIKKAQEKKKAANVDKKIKAAESQPPEMKGKNKVDKKIDIDLLSTDEFDALPEETLRRMRGDFG